MKRIINLCILVALSISAYAQVPYAIKGTVNIKQPVSKIIVQIEKAGGYVWDSIPVNNGKFEFKGSVSRPAWASLKLLVIDTTKSKTSAKKNEGDDDKEIDSNYLKRTTLLYLNGPMEITWTEQGALVSGGGEENRLYNQEVDFKKLFSDEKNSILTAFVRKYPNSYVSLDLIKMLMANAMVAKTFEPVYNLLSDQMKATPEGKEWAKRLILAKRFGDGKPAPGFIQPDVTGNPVSFSSYKGKYVLLDFWASWCAPCRATHPSLTKTYQKFKDKNFTVLSVSLDEKKDAWLKAIKDDGLIWTQVGDMKGFNNAVGQMYGIKSIPQNYLIDPNGLIVAQNLHYDELDKKLSELLLSKKN